MTAVFKKINLNYFYNVLALAILARIYSDIFVLHRWQIHTGELFPYRQGLLFLPLLPPVFLILEWVTSLAACYFLANGRVRLGAGIAVGSYFLSLSQMYQNQKVLLLIVFATLLIKPVTRGVAQEYSTKDFLKWQIILVYFFSALHKILGKFSTGETLKDLFEKVLQFPYPITQKIYLIAAWIVIMVELIAPLLLLLKPRAGVVLVIALHIGLAIVMPDILAFSLVMIALSMLFLKESEA